MVHHADSEIPQPLDLVRIQREGIPDVPWLAEPYLVQGEIHLLVGDGSTGKTFLALDTALGLAAGQPVFIDCPVSRPYRVLYVDEDGNEAQIKRRLMGLAAGRAIVFDEAPADQFVIYTGCGFRLDPRERAQRLLSVIERHKPDVLMLDALRAFHDGNENDSRDMTRVLRHSLRPAVKDHLLTCLVLHHTSKGSEELSAKGLQRSAARASRGSTEIRNAVDTVLYVERRNDGPSTLAIDKTRSLEDTDKPDPLTFTVRQEGDGSLRIARVDGPGAAQKPKLVRAKVDLAAALPEGSCEELTHRALMERLPGLKEGVYRERTARQALKEMVPSVFSQRESGKNVLYRRAEAG